MADLAPIFDLFSKPHPSRKPTPRYKQFIPTNHTITIPTKAAPKWQAASLSCAPTGQPPLQKPSPLPPFLLPHLSVPRPRIPTANTYPGPKKAGYGRVSGLTRSSDTKPPTLSPFRPPRPSVPLSQTPRADAQAGSKKAKNGRAISFRRPSNADDSDGSERRERSTGQKSCANDKRLKGKLELRSMHEEPR